MKHGGSFRRDGSGRTDEARADEKLPDWAFGAGGQHSSLRGKLTLWHSVSSWHNGHWLRLLIPGLVKFLEFTYLRFGISATAPDLRVVSRISVPGPEG
jgi:hypothetical protein